MINGRRSVIVLMSLLSIANANESIKENMGNKFQTDTELYNIAKFGEETKEIDREIQNSFSIKWDINPNIGMEFKIQSNQIYLNDWAKETYRKIKLKNENSIVYRFPIGKDLTIAIPYLRLNLKYPKIGIKGGVGVGYFIEGDKSFLDKTVMYSGYLEREAKNIEIGIWGGYLQTKENEISKNKLSLGQIEPYIGYKYKNLKIELGIKNQKAKVKGRNGFSKSYTMGLINVKVNINSNLVFLANTKIGKQVFDWENKGENINPLPRVNKNRIETGLKYTYKNFYLKPLFYYEKWETLKKKEQSKQGLNPIIEKGDQNAFGFGIYFGFKF
jgi:hypothetical protein